MNRTGRRPWGRPASSNPRAGRGEAFATSRALYHEQDRAGRGEPLFARTAKGWLPVGHIVERDGVRLFAKRVDSRRHRLLSPPAYAVSKGVLDRLTAVGAVAVEVTEMDTGRVLRAPLRAFAEEGVSIRRGGFEGQVALPLARWQVEDPRQGCLFAEAER